MEKSKKNEVVDWVKQSTSNDETVVFTGFNGLTVEHEGQLRIKMKESGAVYKVVKNTLLKIGLSDRIEKGQLDDILVGTTSVSIGPDPVAVSKTLKEFVKTNEALVIKGGLLGSKLLSSSDVNTMADLPSKDQLLGQLVGMLQQPLTQLVGALSSPMRDLAAVLKQVEEQKQ